MNILIDVPIMTANRTNTIVLSIIEIKTTFAKLTEIKMIHFTITELDHEIEVKWTFRLLIEVIKGITL